MKLFRPDSKRVPTRVKGSEVLTRPPVEEGFKADKVVTAEDRKKLLAYVLSEKQYDSLFFWKGQWPVSSYSRLK